MLDHGLMRTFSSRSESSRSDSGHALRLSVFGLQEIRANDVLPCVYSVESVCPDYPISLFHWAWFQSLLWTLMRSPFPCTPFNAREEMNLVEVVIEESQDVAYGRWKNIVLTQQYWENNTLPYWRKRKWVYRTRTFLTLSFHYPQFLGVYY